MNRLQAPTFISHFKALIDLRKAALASLSAAMFTNGWCQASLLQEDNPESKPDRKKELRSTVRQQLATGNLTKLNVKTLPSDSNAPSARQLSSTERTELRRQLASDSRGQRASVAAVEQR